MNGQLWLLLVSDILLKILETKATKNDGCQSFAELAGDTFLLFCLPGWSWGLFSRYHRWVSCMFQKMWLKSQPSCGGAQGGGGVSGFTKQVFSLWSIKC